MYDSQKLEQLEFAVYLFRFDALKVPPSLVFLVNCLLSNNISNNPFFTIE